MRHILALIIFYRHSLGEVEATKYSPRTVLLNSISFVKTPTFTSGTCCKFLLLPWHFLLCQQWPVIRLLPYRLKSVNS